MKFAFNYQFNGSLKYVVAIDRKHAYKRLQTFIYKVTKHGNGADF